MSADPVPDPAPAPPAPAAAGRPELGAEPATERREAARLEILRALERGEVDIETASDRLENLEEAGPLTFRGWS